MKIIIIHFCLRFFYYLCAVRVITLKHNNEELRNTNGCYLVTQFSSNPTNRFILSELSFLAKVTKTFCNNTTDCHIFSRLAFPYVHSPTFTAIVGSENNSLAY